MPLALSRLWVLGRPDLIVSRIAFAEHTVVPFADFKTLVENSVVHLLHSQNGLVPLTRCQSD